MFANRNRVLFESLQPDVSKTAINSTTIDTLVAFERILKGGSWWCEKFVPFVLRLMRRERRKVAVSA
jgi:hypothetical protein